MTDPKPAAPVPAPINASPADSAGVTTGPAGVTSAPSSAASGSTLEPLKHPVFRLLWGTWLVANTCMWMNDVAAAWLMTSLTTSPVWVALVQTAATLPVFLLGLPSGALADILDRRRYFIFTQFWIAGVALVLCAVILAGTMTPLLLLVLTFCNGIGLAMRWPVFSAVVPELVPRAQLSAALALNGIAMNASRIIGPLVAGALIASAGSVWVFVLNALLSVACGLVIMRWERVHVVSPLGRERLLSAMRVGLQYVGQSARLRAVLLRIFLFFFHSTALMALLPLVAQALPGGGSGAGTFTLLLASFGAGAIAAALFLPALRRALNSEARVQLGTAVQAGATAAVAFAPNVTVAALAMLVGGIAWIATANTLAVLAQLALPDWVRARGMSIYQMAVMGGSAAGAAIWGQTAAWSSVPASLAAAAVSGVVAMALAGRLVRVRGAQEDLTPSNEFHVPVVDQAPHGGLIEMSVEYRIDPARADEFRALMQQSRRSRLRQGALSWELLRDISDPGCYVEKIVDESWTEHLRRYDRVSAADVELRDRRREFHLGDKPPLVTRRVVDLAARA